MILAAEWYHNILATLFGLLAILLMLVILLQRGKGTGLSGAFGGAGGTAATFGSKTGDVLTWITVIGAVIMLLFAVVLNYVFRPIVEDLSQDEIAPVNSWYMPDNQPAVSPDLRLFDDATV